MDRSELRTLLAAYGEGYGLVLAALQGVTEAELDRRSAPDTWTAREIVHHLADSETISSIRLRRLVAEDEPAILAYDEMAWSRRLHYDRPIDTALALFRAVRDANVVLLSCLSEQEWAREGTHSASGRYAMEDWLRIYVAHARDHAEQIGRARGATGATPQGTSQVRTPEAPATR